MEFNRETYNSLYEVQNEIKDTKSMIEYHKKKLLQFASMTEPNKLCPKDYDPLAWITSEVEESIEELIDYTIALYKLELLEEYWEECHNSNDDAITYKGDRGKYGLPHAYIEGDFIKMDEDTKDVYDEFAPKKDDNES